MPKKKLTLIDLFSGAGGMSLGFEEEGFKNIFSIEFNPIIAKTYKRNFPKHNLIIDDISKISDERINELKGSEIIDVVIGGPPCQGFSMAGNIGRSFIEDERNFLFKEFVRVVSLVKPRMFVMENVARLKIHNNGKTITDIVSKFEALGYHVENDVLQSADYGIPQKRQRIFIVGYKNGKFSFPKEIDRKVTVSEAIGDLPPLGNNDSSAIPNHFSMKHSQQMLNKMSYIMDGGTREDIPVELRPKSGDIRKYIRYASDEPSVTITGDMRKVFHYSQNRALSPRELARLQTFPDSFIFEGNSISIQQQIGNAVPPKLARKIAESVKNALLGADNDE